MSSVLFPVVMSQAPLFYCVIPGRPRVKKNSKRIYSYAAPKNSSGRANRIRVISSEQFLQWEREALVAIKQAAMAQAILSPLEGELEAEFVFYLENRQAEPDTSNLIEGPQDALEKIGVIKNDKQIVRLRAEKIFGHEPQTVILLRKLERESA